MVCAPIQELLNRFYSNLTNNMLQLNGNKPIGFTTNGKGFHKKLTFWQSVWQKLGPFVKIFQWHIIYKMKNYGFFLHGLESAKINIFIFMVPA